MANLAVLVPVLVLAVFVNSGDSVRCWTCSSDLNPFCADPFIPSSVGGRIQQDNHLYRLENCDSNSGAAYPLLTTSKSVCKKQKKYVNGYLIISRGCTWKQAKDYSSQCPNTSNGPNEVVSYCETCDYDACNGASALGKALAILLAPLALVIFK